MNDVDYSDITVRLNVLYDCVYNDDSTECYSIDTINKNDIVLENLKEHSDYFKKVFSDCKFKLIDIGNNKIRFKRMGNSSYPCTVTIGKYNNKNDSDNIKGNELKNIFFLYLLSELVITDKLKNILLPIAYFDVTYNKLKNVDDIMANAISEKFSEKDSLYCLVTEQYFKMNTLKSFINENKNISIKQWKSIIFQVLYCLHKINERLPNFSHNMLNMDSIKMYKKNNGTEKFKTQKNNFEIQTEGIEIKISDFDKANTKGFFDNDEEPENKDVFIFINNLNNYLTDIKYDIPKELSEFMSNVLKNNSNADSEDKLLPINMIKGNSFFEDFLNNEMNVLSVSAVDVSSEKISDLNEMNSSISYNSDKIEEKNLDTYNNMKGGKKSVSNLVQNAEKLHNDKINSSDKDDIDDSESIDIDDDIMHGGANDVATKKALLAKGVEEMRAKLGEIFGPTELKQAVDKLNEYEKAEMDRLASGMTGGGNSSKLKKALAKLNKIKKDKMKGGNSESDKHNDPNRLSDDFTREMAHYPGPYEMDYQAVMKYTGQGQQHMGGQQMQMQQPHAQQGSLASFINGMGGNPMMQQQQMPNPNMMMPPQYQPQQMQQMPDMNMGMGMPQNNMMPQMPDMNMGMGMGMPQNNMMPQMGGSKKKYVFYDNNTNQKIIPAQVF